MGRTTDISRRSLLKGAGVAAGAWAAGASGLLGVAGRASAAQRGAGTTPELVKIRAAGSSLGSSNVMRQALKLAAEELGTAEIEIQHMAQGAALLSVRDGSMDVAMFSWANLAQAAEADIDIVAMAPVWASHASIIVPADSEIETLDDLLGKRVVSAERTTGVYSETRAVLAQQGIDIEEDFKLQTMGDSTLMMGLYQNGEFDAMIDSEPVISIELEAGTSRELIQIGTYQAEHNDGRLMPVNSWGVRREWAEEHDIEMLHQLFTRASEIGKSSIDPYLASMEDSGMTQPATELFYERFSKLIVTKFDDQNLADAQLLMDTALDLELITEEHKVTDYIYQEG